MGLLSDFTAYVDSLKRRGANTAREFAADPVGLLGRNVSALSESLPAAPGEPPNEMLARPGMQDWATGVAMNAPTMGLLGATKGKWKDAYHGTKGTFNPPEFDLGRAGRSSGHASADAPVMWTTSRPETANMFIADLVRDAYPIKRYGPRGAGVKSIQTSQFVDGGNIQPLKVKLDKPLVIKGADAEKMIFGDPSGDWREAGSVFADTLRAAKKAGHDGVIIKANPRGSLEFRAEQYLLFDPRTQVKSRFAKDGVIQEKLTEQQALAFALRKRAQSP